MRVLGLAVGCALCTVTSLALAQEGGDDESPFTPAQQAVLQKLIDENAALRARTEMLEQKVGALGAAPPAPARTPGFDLLEPSILAEVDYRVFPDDVEGITGFALARIRPGVVLTPASWFRGVASVEFAGEYPSIVDAYAKLFPAEWAEITLGYSKPPLFASALYEPVHTLPFPDYSAVATSFRIDRDIGADIRFIPRNVPIEAWLRIGNGTGSALGNDEPTPAGYAMLDLVLGRAWVGSAPDERTHGLRLGASAFVESASDRDGVIGKTPNGFIYARPIVVSGMRVVAEAHAIGYLGPVRLTAETALAREGRSRDDDGNPETPRIELDPLTSYGVGAEAAWVVHGQPRGVGVAPRPVPAQDGSWDGGAFEIAARYDGLWLREGDEEIEAAGSQAASLSLKWWPTDFFGATLSGYTIHYRVPPIEEPERSLSWGIKARFGFYWGLTRF